MSKPALKQGKPILLMEPGKPVRRINDKPKPKLNPTGLGKTLKAIAAMPPPPPRFSTKWEVGAKAARAGAKITACPYPPSSYDYVTWLNGYAFAKHQMSIGDPPF